MRLCGIGGIRRCKEGYGGDGGHHSSLLSASLISLALDLTVPPRNLRHFFHSTPHPQLPSILVGGKAILLKHDFLESLSLEQFTVNYNWMEGFSNCFKEKVPLGKEMATHSNILVWEIPWTEESGGLQSMGSQKSQTQLNNSTATTKYYSIQNCGKGNEKCQEKNNVWSMTFLYNSLCTWIHPSVCALSDIYIQIQVFVCFIKVKLYFVYKKKKLLFVLIIKVKHSHVKMLENTERQNFKKQRSPTTSPAVSAVNVSSSIF